jgi:uncharacterized membrane protein YkvA (DUF1232 family)
MTERHDSTIDLHDLLHPDEQRRFRRLCLATSADELYQLINVIELHLQQINMAAVATTDVETAEMIADSLTRLIRSDNAFDDDARAQIRGAVEYFLLADDAVGDLEDVVGFDDDARVVNTVLERIGHPEFAIDLPR